MWKLRLQADSAAGRDGGRHHGLDQDGVSDLLADSKPCVAHLTNNIRVAGEQLDLLLFAKTQLSQTAGHLRSGSQLLDANGGARFHPAERADTGSGAPAFEDELGIKRVWLHREESVG